ncbi:hypothetical protein, conserved, partial [Eimeria maxima]
GLKEATPDAIRDAFLELDKVLLNNWRTQQAGSTGIVALIEELDSPRELLVSGREVLSSFSSKPLLSSLDTQDKIGAFYTPIQSITIGGQQQPAFLITIANVGDSRGTLFHAGGGFSILSRDHKPTNPEELERIKKAGGFVSSSPASVPRVDGILALSRAFGVYEPESMNWVFVSHFMMTLLYELKNDLTEAAVKLLEQAYQAFSGDNISVLLTRFEKGEEKERKYRRFEVTPEGHVVSEESESEGQSAAAAADAAAAAAAPPSSPSAADKNSLEAFKGPLKPAGEGPITL